MRITVLGLGRMGSPMARNLIAVGHDVTVYDRTPERAAALSAGGGKAAFTVAEAVANAQIALTMVTGDEAEDALVQGPEGLLRHLPAGAIHLCMSTIGVETSRRLALDHEGAGQGYVAAPVLGKPSAAFSRHLWILAAGPEIQVNRCLGVLEALGRGVTRVGLRPELAHALKLGTNAFTVAMVETLSEVLAFGEKAGFSPSEYMRILNLGLVKSPLLDSFGGVIVRRDHEPSDQTLDLATKDMELLIQASQELKVAMPMADPLLQALHNAQARGLGGKDLTALSQIRREAANLEEPPEPPARPQPRKDRRKDRRPRKMSEPERRRDAEPAPAEPLPETQEPQIQEATYAAKGEHGSTKLALGKTSHFQVEGNSVWAWVDGRRHATFWQTLSEVERALGQVLFVRIQRRILVNPQAVQDFKPLILGRARLTVAGGLELTAGREPARRLKFLLGL